MKHTLIGMGLLSAATLLLQVALTRVFSIAQFYHFAFLVVSLALLGFGASGSLLALAPRLRQSRLTPYYALGFAVTTLVAYFFINNWPFDSYSIAWDRRQVYLLIGNLLGLAVPFLFVGLLIAVLLSENTAEVGRVYGVNLFGSAAGAIFAPMLLTALGSERVVILCAALAGIAALFLGWPQKTDNGGRDVSRPYGLRRFCRGASTYAPVASMVSPDNTKDARRDGIHAVRRSK